MKEPRERGNIKILNSEQEKKELTDLLIDDILYKLDYASVLEQADRHV